MDVILVLLVDWLIFNITPNAIEGLGVVLVIISVVGLSTWDIIADFMRKRFPSTT